ncbi:MAG: enolase [Lysobacterales bacterium]|jgi:enolase|nr:MAG: enolase [Xanthomonadales bacterium]
MSALAIADLHGREILDSRGHPTVFAEIVLACGARGRAAVPSGASTGSREALELRDGDPSRYLGRGVRRAVMHLNGPIRDALLGVEVGEQESLDRRLRELDGTANKSRLGANAILAASLAAARARAAARGVDLWQDLIGAGTPCLPVPLLNILNGGAHADNNVDFQEFMIVPLGAPSFGEGLRIAVEVYHALKSVLRQRSLATGVGDEGGFAPDLASNREAVELILEAIARAGFRPGEEVALALDVAASEFFSEGRYRLEGEGRVLAAEDLVELYAQWCRDYPIVSIEDGMAEHDLRGWKLITERLGDRVQLVGDDLFVTNPEILRRGVAEGIANALLVKPNQIGTLSETLEAIAVAEAAGYARILSHRSGETEDPIIADLALGTGASQIKTGAPCRSDRVAKYNRLLEIEEGLGGAARYAGRGAFPRAAVRS